MRMQNAESLTEEQIQQFLAGSERIEFRGQNRAELYGWVERVLVAQEYATRSKKQRGAVRAYIVKMTGLSLPQAGARRTSGEESLIKRVAPPNNLQTRR